MSSTASSQEIQRKLSGLREQMDRHGLAAVRLRGVDWFSWATGGGNSTVILTNEVGVAEVLVTTKSAFVLTNRIEARRMKEEEVPRDLEVREFPWAEGDEAYDRFIRDVAPIEKIASDRPRIGERTLPAEILRLKLVMGPEEVERYRALGRDAGEAMKAALTRAEPGMTEFQLAGEGAKEMWSRGMHGTLVLVSGHERLLKHRHPFPTTAKLGRRAMMVYCARRYGLFANLTRFVYFENPTDEEIKLHGDIAKIEAAVLNESRPGRTTSQAFEALAKAYTANGYPEDILKHHQGGPTGYLSREEVAGPTSLRPQTPMIAENMAMAWNPSLTGAKIEDTCLVTSKGVEFLTEINGWPSETVEGRKRPTIWVR